MNDQHSSTASPGKKERLARIARKAPIRTLKTLIHGMIELEVSGLRRTLIQEAERLHGAQARLDQRLDEFHQQELAFDARMSTLEAREARVSSLVEGVRKDLLATNHRINWMERETPE